MRPLYRSECRRWVAALRAKPRPGARAARVPTERATSNEPCFHCGVPGFRGCEHQLPCEPHELDETAKRRGAQHQKSRWH